MNSLIDSFTKDIDTKLPNGSQAARAYVKLWIAGSAGAYFTFLFRNLSFDLPTFDRNVSNVPYTLCVLIRYVYLFWFLGYFFASNLPNEANIRRITWWHIAFNMIQAMAGFTAAYFLDFLTRSGTRFTHSIVAAIVFANGAIVVICFVSFICFGFRKQGRNETRDLNCLRMIALVIAGVAAIGIYGRQGELAPCTLCLVIVSQLVLWVILGIFIRGTIREVDLTATENPVST